MEFVVLLDEGLEPELFAPGLVELAELEDMLPDVVLDVLALEPISLPFCQVPWTFTVCPTCAERSWELLSFAILPFFSSSM